MMNEGVTIPHPPAMKVGGRRLSVTTKQRRNSTSDSGKAEQKVEEDVTTDYPRPAAPSGTDVLHQDHQEDEAPKKDDKQGFNPENQLFEQAYWKGTTPTRDLHGNMRGPTMGMRIRQPGGKALGL